MLQIWNILLCLANNGPLNTSVLSNRLSGGLAANDLAAQQTIWGLKTNPVRTLSIQSFGELILTGLNIRFGLGENLTCGIINSYMHFLRIRNIHYDASPSGERIWISNHRTCQTFLGCHPCMSLSTNIPVPGKVILSFNHRVVAVILSIWLDAPVPLKVTQLTCAFMPKEMAAIVRQNKLFQSGWFMFFTFLMKCETHKYNNKKDWLFTGWELGMVFI